MPDQSKLAEINARFSDRAHEPATLFLLTAKDALAFLDELERAGLGLAGVEGFRAFREGGAQPLQEFSNDAAEFSGTEQQFLQATRNLIVLGGRESIYFQVVAEMSSG